MARVFESGTYVGQRSTLGEGDGGIRITFCTSRIPKRGEPHTVITPQYYLHEGKLYRADVEVSLDEGAYIELGDEVTEIRVGTPENDRVIYRAGDEIPLCSAEEEEEIRAHIQRTARADGEIPWDGMAVRRAEEEKIS